MNNKKDEKITSGERVENEEASAALATENTAKKSENVPTKIAKATGILVAVQLFMRLFGIIEAMVIAKLGGSGSITDIYFLARKITSPIMSFGEQVIMHSFLPSFVHKMEEEGEAKAWQLASTVINLMLLIMVIIGIIGFLYTSQFLGFFLAEEGVKSVGQYLNGIITSAWKDNPKYMENIPFILKVTKVFLGAMIFMAISSITYCLLNSYKQFGLPAASDFVLKATTLIIGVALNGKIGLIAFALGFLVGAFLKLLTQVIGIKVIRAESEGVKYSPKINLKDPAFKSFLLLALPLIIGWVFSTFRIALEAFFLAQASSMVGAGALTTFENAKKICDIPITVFPYVFGIALFPFLNDIASRGEKGKLREMLTTATKIMLLIFIPLAIAVSLFSKPIVSVLFASEKFTAQAVAMTSENLSLYAFIMIFSALEIIVNQFYFANKDTLRPTLTGIYCLPLYAITAYLGVMHFGIGALGVVLAIIVYRMAKVIILYVMIRHKTDGLPIKSLITTLLKIILALIPFAIICYVTLNIDAIQITGHADGKVEKILILLPYLVSGCLAFLSYFAALYFLKTEELTFVINKIRKR